MCPPLLNDALRWGFEASRFGHYPVGIQLSATDVAVPRSGHPSRERIRPT